MDFLDVIKSCVGNVSGTGTTILLAPKSWFTTIAQAAANPANPTELVDIVGDHVFDTDKGFIRLEITDETGNVQSNAVGEKDGRSFEHIFTGFHPNNSSNALGMLTKFASCEWIVLVPELQNGVPVYRQIGSAFRGAYNVDENNYNSGTASADRRGTSIIFKATGQPTHAPFYKGDIVYLTA